MPRKLENSFRTRGREKLKMVLPCARSEPLLTGLTDVISVINDWQYHRNHCFKFLIYFSVYNNQVCF